MDMNCWCIVCGRWCQTSAEMREHKSLTNHLGFLRAQPTDQYTCRTCDLLLPRVAAVLDHLALSGHAHVRKLSAAQVEALSSLVPLAGSDSYVVVTEEGAAEGPPSEVKPAVTVEEENENASYDCCTCGQHFLLFEDVNAHTAATGHERFLKTTDLPSVEAPTDGQPATQGLQAPQPDQPDQHQQQEEDASVTSPLYRLLPSQAAHLSTSSPYPERSTQLSICTQCGKWFATDAVRVDHRNLTGHQLFLPVKEKGARTAYKCLDCSQLLRSASQVAQHQWEYGHDQFATLCESRPLQPEVPGAVVDGEAGDGVAMGTHGGGAAGGLVGGTNSGRKEVGYFECTECGVRLARSSDLPAHFAKSGHQKFSRLQPCSTGIALETWNHSGRMVRGQVISSLSEAPRNNNLNNPSPASDSLCPSSSASPSGLGAAVSGPSVANRRLALPLLPVCVCLCEPHTFRTAVLLVSRHDAAEVDELVDRLRTVVTAGYNLEVSVYHCTLCTKRCHNLNVMLDHGKHYHQVPEDLLEKGVLYMTIEIERLELRVKYACLLCSAEHADREALWQHISMEHSRNCPICGEAVAKLSNAMRHHMKTAGCVNRCVDCGAAMDSAWGLKRHRETACPALKARSSGRKRRHGDLSRGAPDPEEEEEVVYQCKHCNREFSDLARMREHRYLCLKRPKNQP